MVALSKRLGSAVWSGSSFLLGAGAENSGCTHRLSAARSRIREALASWLNIVVGRLAVRRMNQGRWLPARRTMTLSIGRHRLCSPDCADNFTGAIGRHERWECGWTDG